MTQTVGGHKVGGTGNPRTLQLSEAERGVLGRGGEACSGQSRAGWGEGAPSSSLHTVLRTCLTLFNQDALLSTDKEKIVIISP